MSKSECDRLCWYKYNVLPTHNAMLVMEFKNNRDRKVEKFLLALFPH